MKNLINAIATEYAKKADTASRDIESIENVLRAFSTPAKWDAYKNGKIDRATANAAAQKRAERTCIRRADAEINKVKYAETVPTPEDVYIRITYTKNRTWGSNPHAEVETTDGTAIKHTYGTATGSGYDKTSAAVAYALNANPGIMRALYEKEEQRLSDGSEKSRRDYIGYGSGYNVLPCFEGGVGMPAICKILESIGYNVTSSEDGSIYIATIRA